MTTVPGYKEVTEFEKSFQDCLSLLINSESQFTENTPNTSTQNTDNSSNIGQVPFSIEMGIERFHEAAQKVNCFFIQRAMIEAHTKPEVPVLKGIEELREEINRKDELLDKYYKKLDTWKTLLSDADIPDIFGNTMPAPSNLNTAETFTPYRSSDIPSDARNIGSTSDGLHAGTSSNFTARASAEGLSVVSSTDGLDTDLSKNRGSVSSTEEFGAVSSTQGLGIVTSSQDLGPVTSTQEFDAGLFTREFSAGWNTQDYGVGLHNQALVAGPSSQMSIHNSPHSSYLDVSGLGAGPSTQMTLQNSAHPAHVGMSGLNARVSTQVPSQSTAPVHVMRDFNSAPSTFTPNMPMPHNQMNMQNQQMHQHMYASNSQPAGLQGSLGYMERSVRNFTLPDSST